MFSNLREDIARYTRRPDGSQYRFPVSLWKMINPGLLAIMLHRYVFYVNRKFVEDDRRLLRRLLKTVYHLGRKIIVIWGKIHISESTSFGPGVRLSGKGQIIIGSKQPIGRNFTVEHNVTVGMGIANETPLIGDNVLIRHDSVVYGDIRVGQGSVIEAESILSKNIPDRCLVKGNPARIVGKEIDRNNYNV